MKKILYSICSALLTSILFFTYFFFKLDLDVSIVLSVLLFLFLSIQFYFKLFGNTDFKTKFIKIEPSLVIHSSRANFKSNDIYLGGTLYLLADRLIFQTNIINFTYRKEHVIMLENINDINCKPRKLIFKTTNSEIEMLTINNSESWKDKISQQKNKFILNE